MIWHDRIEVWQPGGGIGYDDYSFPIYGPPTSEKVPGEVFPLGTEELLAAGFVSTRYRMVLAPAVELPQFVSDDNKLRFGWGAYPIDAGDPFGATSGLRLDGSVERHVLRGRLHHYELITKTVQ